MRGSTIGAWALFLVAGISCSSLETTSSSPDAVQCCKLGTPSCNCFVVGTSKGGACETVCDLAPTTVTLSTDEQGCPRYVWSSSGGSCFPRPPPGRPSIDAGDAGDLALDCSDCQALHCAKQIAACRADAASMKQCDDAVVCVNACTDSACTAKCLASAEGPALAFLQCTSDCLDCGISAPATDAATPDAPDG